MMGFAAAIINMIIIMVLGDYTAPLVEESLSMPGVSLPHGFTTAYAPIAMLFNWILDKIPGIRDIDVNTDMLQEKFGVFGEPMIIGTVIGLVIGVLAGYDVTGVLQLAVSLGAVLVLIPRMASLLMEGLLPVSDAASDFVEKRFSNRGKIYIGLDSAVGVGHPVTLAISFVLVPLCIFRACTTTASAASSSASLSWPSASTLLPTLLRSSPPLLPTCSSTWAALLRFPPSAMVLTR